MPAVDLVNVLGNIVDGNIGGVHHGIGNQPGGGLLEIPLVRDGDALSEQLQTV